MKSYNVTFQNGSFLETGTGKRIIPQQGKTYVLAGDDDAFATEDPRLSLFRTLDAKEKLPSLREKYPNLDFHPLLQPFQELYFEVALVKNLANKYENKYVFKVHLLEPLYLMKAKHKSGTEVLDWRLADCAVRLEACVYGNLSLSDKIEMPTLNSLYTAVIQFYFAFQRSPSTNIFKTFYKEEKGFERSGRSYGFATQYLADLRVEIAQQYKINSPHHEITRKPY